MASTFAPCVILSPTEIRQPSGADRLRETLAATPWGYALTEVAVHFEAGCVHLRGSVPSYYMKQMAQSLAAKECDGLRVVNLLVVQPRAVER